MRVGFRGVQLLIECLLELGIQVMLNTVSRLMQMIIRQSEVFLHVCFPQAVPADHVAGMILAGRGELIAAGG